MKNMFLGVFLTAFFCLSHAGVISYSYQAKLNPDSIEEHSHQVLEAFEGFLDAPHIEKAATIFKNNNFNRAITYQCLIGIGFFNNHNSFGKLRFQQKIEAISDYTNFLSTIASPYELFFKENKAHDLIARFSKNNEAVALCEQAADFKASLIIDNEDEISSPICQTPNFKSVDEVKVFFDNTSCSSRSILESITPKSNKYLLKELASLLLPDLDFDRTSPLPKESFDMEKIRIMLTSGNSTVIKHALLKIEEDNFTLIGIANINGQFSGHFKRLGEKSAESHRMLLVALNYEVLMDRDIINRLDGFILPGNDDTYNSVRNYSFLPFSWNDMQPGMTHETEHLYQLIYSYAMDRKMPLLGTCAGNQHLALHQYGKLAKLPRPFTGYIDVTLVPATLNHYMAMNPSEQLKALNQCHLPEMTVQGTVMHSYAIEEPGEDVVVGGYTPGKRHPVIMAASMGGHISTFQFHPEYAYKEGTDGKDINSNIIDNFIHQVSAYHTMKSNGAAFYYHRDMQSLLRRLNDCQESRFKADEKNEVWFSGRTSYKYTMPVSQRKLSVQLTPGVDLSDYSHSEDELEWVLINNKNGMSLTIDKSNPRQVIELIRKW